MSKARGKNPKPEPPTNPDFNEVQLYDAKPNPMFPEWLTCRLQFLRYAVAVKCAHCGRKSKFHWTLMMSFRIAMESAFTLKAGEILHPPLTPVCRDHIMKPELPHLAPKEGKVV